MWMFYFFQASQSPIKELRTKHTSTKKVCITFCNFKSSNALGPNKVLLDFLFFFCHKDSINDMTFLFLVKKYFLVLMKIECLCFMELLGLDK